MLHWVVLPQRGFKVFMACDALSDTQYVSLNKTGLKQVIITKLKCSFFFFVLKKIAQLKAVELVM